ncbi:hypothetical protein TTHERM_00001410 (macronuclear) [Tetrahymena thermophila SB210]|uniref:Uncharacterized protein n=1 Tax=Tetrahymena thermophila (strain SB210) TaxID=312017 RepID=Q22SJ6_TETTS|nr:hypothetical protein TTHERM_00001410 [Tetrahymena thermophila SB210]EAR87776.2 hypothetical protein TTHERM_00001410 [Tetrahymena thermophila SB210]|eukprot:XP_001008021.2 hypothetical protein TTHERM_00001410 [Tetrahymena thermophila SB210]
MFQIIINQIDILIEYLSQAKRLFQQINSFFCKFLKKQMQQQTKRLYTQQKQNAIILYNIINQQKIIKIQQRKIKMSFLNRTKYEEFIMSKNFEMNIKKLSIEDQIFPLNRIQIKNFNFQGNALFLPTYLYQREKLEINIDNKQINLLDCMYIYDKADDYVILQIVNFKDYSVKAFQKVSYPDISYYLEEEKRKIKEDKQKQREQSPKLSCCNDDSSFNFSLFDDDDYYYYQKTNKQQDNQYFTIYGEIVGGKYLFLCIKSHFKIELNIFNLDLSLILQHNVENIYCQYPNQDYDDQHIDYIEPGLIYYLYKTYIIKIDINKQIVISNRLEYKFPKTLLLRLLPVTSSEFKYYFGKNKNRNLLGYNEDDDNKIILFVIAENIIYQLNMHNLDILRQTNIFNFYQSQSLQQKKVELKHFGVQKILVVPIQLKERQRKKFSNWTFLIQAKQYGYVLQDWKEQNLFKIEQLRIPNEIVWKSKYELGFFINNQNIVSFSDKLYIPSESCYNHYYEFKIFKKKGCRNLSYSYQLKETNFKFYHECHIFNTLPPIIYDNLLTYPIYTDMNIQSLAFYQFKEESKKQAQYILQEIDQSDYKEIFQNANQLIFQNKFTAFVYKLENNKLNHQQFCYESQIQNVQQCQLNLQKSEWIYLKKDDQYFTLNSLELQNQPQESKVKRLQSQIVSFSQFQCDSQNNNIFLPLIYLNNKGQCFAIYDATKQMVIEQTIHITEYTKHILSYFYQQKNEYILIFIKELPHRQKYYYKNIFLFFYSLSMKNYEFKLINFILWKSAHIYEIDIEFSDIHLGAQNNILQMFYQNSYIEFDRKMRFEIKKQIKTNFKFEQQQNINFVNIRDSKYILQQKYYNNGSQQKYITICDIESNQLRYIDLNYIIEKNIELKNENSNLPIFLILSSGKLMISFRTDKIYQISQQF